MNLRGAALGSECCATLGAAWGSPCECCKMGNTLRAPGGESLEASWVFPLGLPSACWETWDSTDDLSLDGEKTPSPLQFSCPQTPTVPVALPAGRGSPVKVTN